MRLIVFGVICVTWCYAENSVGGAQSFIYLAQNLNSDNGPSPSNQFQNFVPFPQGAIKYNYNNLANLQSLPTEVIYGTSKEIPPQPPKPLNLQVIQKQQPLRPSIAPFQQQLQADEATAFPVQLSFSVNHGDYTFLPKPQIFYQSPQLPLPTHHIPQAKNVPPKNFKPSPEVKPFKQLNFQPISYPLPQIQYFGQPTQYPPQPIQHLPRPLPLPVPKHLKLHSANVYPINAFPTPITKPHGHPPVKPYTKGPVSQSEKFRQQIYSKPQERPIDPPKHVQEHRRPPPPPPSPKKQEEEKEEEEDEEEEDDKKEESSGEEEDDEDDEESEEESGDEGDERSSEGDDEDEEDDEEEEEESKVDTEKEASHLPPSHDHGEYDFDNRDYSPTFSAAKYIFNYDDDDERKRPHKKTKHHKEESRPYHQHHIKPDFRSNSHVKQVSAKPKRVENPREEPPKNNYFYFYGPNEPIPKQSQSAPVVKNLHKEKWYLTSKKI